jgi:hypothetical protein
MPSASRPAAKRRCCSPSAWDGSAWSKRCSCKAWIQPARRARPQCDPRRRLARPRARRCAC